MFPAARSCLSPREGESVVYTLDGCAPKTYSTPIPAPESGDHRLSFHAVDELGIAGASHTVNLAADRSAPNSSLHFEGPQQARESSTIISGATRIVLDANAGAVGGATLEYSLGGNRWQEYSGPFSIKSSGNTNLPIAPAIRLRLSNRRRNSV